MGLTLVQFENALVRLDPFVKFHPFETWKVLLDSIKSHYESVSFDTFYLIDWNATDKNGTSYKKRQIYTKRHKLP